MLEKSGDSETVRESLWQSDAEEAFRGAEWGKTRREKKEKRKKSKKKEGNLLVFHFFLLTLYLLLANDYERFQKIRNKAFRHGRPRA